MVFVGGEGGGDFEWIMGGNLVNVVEGEVDVLRDGERGGEREVVVEGGGACRCWCWCWCCW